MADVGGPVVGHHAFDPDPVSGVEGKRALEEADGRRRSLVGEDLDVGQAGEVIDGDVDALPADLLAANPGGVGPCSTPRSGAPGDPFARAALDAPELLDVDVDELARPAAFVAVDRLGGLEPRALAEPLPLPARSRPSRAAWPGARRSRRRSTAAGAAHRSP